MIGNTTTTTTPTTRRTRQSSRPNEAPLQSTARLLRAVEQRMSQIPVTRSSPPSGNRSPSNPTTTHHTAVSSAVVPSSPPKPVVNTSQPLDITRGDFSQAPRAFYCPITCDVMSDPVVAADGHTYERSAIAQWLTTRQTSPMTNAKLSSTLLTSNFALRSMIAEYIDAHPTKSV